VILATSLISLTVWFSETTTNAVVLCAYAIGNAAGPFMWKRQYQPRWVIVEIVQIHPILKGSSNHIPWAIITACFVVSAALLLVLRFMLASENGRRDAERRDEKYDEVYVIRSGDSATVGKRVDRVSVLSSS
jgi:hypothetical protein